MKKENTNAIIMAAGYASRFSPLSEVCPKGLLPVRGEVLIERQIRQLNEAGIFEIHIVVGYKKELFQYLEDKFGVHLIVNPQYKTRNNHSSVYAAREYLGNTYLCSSDNYFVENVFLSPPNRSYYAARYAKGSTDEYCLFTDANDRIIEVSVGGQESWYMCGHVFFDADFSRQYLRYLEQEYDFESIKNAYWEQIYMNHLDTLSMYIKRYQEGIIQEFDTLEELMQFDSYYREFPLEKLMEKLERTIYK